VKKTKCIKLVAVSVAIIYTASQTLLSAWVIITFPGNYNAAGSMAQKDAWINDVLSPFLYYELIAFAAMTVLNTVVTIYSILQIFKFTKQLSETNSHVNINRRTFVVHCMLVALETFVILSFLAPNKNFPRASLTISFMIPIGDLLV